MVKGGIRSRRNKKSKSKVAKTAKRILKSVAYVRSQFARFRGKLTGYYAKYLDDEDSKLQKKEIEKLYKIIHGNVTDNYDEIRSFIRARPGILPSIQGIFDLELGRMGRVDSQDSEDFVVSEPTAIVFLHNLLNDDIPDLTMTNYTEDEAINIVNNNIQQHAVLPETKPYGSLGGNKTRKNRQKGV